MVQNSKMYLWIILFVLVWCLCLTDEIRAENTLLTGYKDGFYIRSDEQDGMELRVGGTLQGDYRHYGETARDNRFDIRRARLMFRGQLTPWFRVGLTYEFQGNETKHLIDAYGEAAISEFHSLRFGQFKEPFSLEWQTRNKGLYFAERSMGYSLGPKRDIGLMLHGSFYHDTVNYAAGLFNGDGIDGSSGGESDEPELAARLVVSPFKASSAEWLKFLQIGASATYAQIDLSNVDLEVKSSGMTGTGMNLYVLGHNTKFGVIQNADNRIRTSLEAAWAWESFALTGEYFRLKYTDLKPSGKPARDAEFSSWYVSAMCCLTGEDFVLSRGVMKPLHPESVFNPAEGAFGAVVLAARAEYFTGDEDWINPVAFVSVKEADAYSVALNWILHPMHRMIFDYTYTDFSDPVRVRVNPDGNVDYVEKESVLTLRFSTDF
ncbi:OprO/OprP family phosphate-selective porin [Desulfonema magnum]|uniref:Phosphate-selective porin domain-containing protein n=1 Tax=Desulfonema magnum TaxID=45655 RepID=A0A975BPX0_9BACT|nr:porin [Desulfonema magnum]QTA89521.1 Phosphate-selective porin domain-containing protein [Desulfonema magnum]